MRKTIEQRFFEKVNIVPGGCWLWMAGTINKGKYGRFHPAPRRSIMAHEWSYRLFIGEIPYDEDDIQMDLDHYLRCNTCLLYTSPSPRD